MTLPEVTMAIKSIKAAVNIAKGFSELKTEYEIKSATSDLLDSIIDVQNNLLSIQSSYGEVLDSKRNLEKKLIELEDWERTKLNYSLIEITSGVFVYVSKESQKSQNKPPWFCAKCYNEKKLSPFQRKHPNHNDFICHNCGSQFSLPIKSSPPKKDNLGWMGV